MRRGIKTLCSVSSHRRCEEKEKNMIFRWRNGGEHQIDGGQVGIHTRVYSIAKTADSALKRRWNGNDCSIIGVFPCGG